MHAYVINLERSSDRRAHITSELQKTGLDYELVSAVDGRQVDLSDRGLVDPSLTSHLGVPEGALTSLLAGSVGCALSHLQVYEKIIEQGLDRALVLEDDIILPADLGSFCDAVAGHLTGAEVALLSSDSRDPCRLSTQDSIRLPSGHVLALPIDIRQPCSSGAYVVTREACERMVKSMLPIRVQADGWWFYFREGLLDRVRCVAPLPIPKNAHFTSTIGSYSHSTGIKGQVAEMILRRRIPVVDQALFYRRKRIYRRWSKSELVDVPFIEKPSRID